MLMKRLWVRYILCGLVVLTGLADFITFSIEQKYQVFDMSPLTLLTTNDIVLFIIKFSVITALCYLLLKPRDRSDYLNYLYIMSAVYLIIFQSVGAISNRQVAEAAPPVEAAPSKEVRLQTGLNFAFVWGYFPIGFSMLCFWLWKIGWG